MNIPKRITLAGHDVVRARFELPNGKILSLSRGEVYETSDPKELDYFSKQRVVHIREIKGKDLEKYISQQIIPSIENLTITAEMVDEYKWTTEAEEKVIAKLTEQGYIIEAPDPEPVFYKVTDKDRVKNEGSDTFLPVGTIINSNEKFEKTIGQMTGYSWIELYIEEVE